MKAFHFLLIIMLFEVAQAAPPVDPNQRLRDTLKNTMLQLRTAETERATLQANQFVNEAKIKERNAEVEKLNKQIAKLTKEAIAEQEVSKKEIDTLKTKQEAQEKQIFQLSQALEKWKAGYNDVVKIAKEREALRVKAVSKAIVAERKLTERERQNLDIYTTGREILDRLESFGLGTAVTAREPFIGLTKVKLQNLVQDYGDKLQNNKYNPFTEKEADKAKQLEAESAAAEVEKPKQP